jgi:hypothetical protein
MSAIAGLGQIGRGPVSLGAGVRWARDWAEVGRAICAFGPNFKNVKFFFFPEAFSLTCIR